MEEPSDVIYNTETGILKLAKTDVERTCRNIDQVTQEEVEQLAQPVDLQLDGNAEDNEPRSK